MSSDQVLLDAQDVGRRATSSDSWLIRNATLQVNNQDRIALTGPTGSGKTLLLRSLSMLDEIDEGTIKLSGTSPTRNEIPQYRSRVTYVPQRASLLEGTVEDNLQLPFSLACYQSETYSQEWVVTQLEALGRQQDFLSSDTSDLSGGERQVVALLRTLQLTPQILLMDEPTASLDPDTSQQVEAIIQDWITLSDSARAFVLVTHDASQANRIATRQLRMKDGLLSELESR